MYFPSLLYLNFALPLKLYKLSALLPPQYSELFPLQSILQLLVEIAPLPPPSVDPYQHSWLYSAPQYAAPLAAATEAQSSRVIDVSL